MANDSHPEPTELEKIQRQLVQVARDIEQLSRSATDRQQFFSELLRQLVEVLNAIGGVVWLADDRGQLAKQANVGWDKLGLADDPLAFRQNQQLLAETLGSGEAKFLIPNADDATTFPQQQIVFVAAVHQDETPVGVIEIFHRRELPAAAQSGHLQYIEQMAAFASRFLTNKQKLPQEQDQAKFWNDFEQFLLKMQRTTELDEIAATAAEHSRFLLGVDRVSVAYVRGKKIDIRSVGSSDAVNLHANLLTSMKRLIEVVLPTGEPLISTGKKGERPPHVEKALDDFISQSRARLVMVVGLFEPPQWSDDVATSAESSKKDMSRSRASTDQPVGCLVIEHSTQVGAVAMVQERAILLADHIAASLTNARRYQQIFLLPLWRTIGKSREWFQGRRLAITMAVITVLALLIAALVLIPADYRVEAAGRLMPVEKSHLFAPWGGKVVDVLVEAGKWVESGTPLLRIENDELSTQLLTTKNETLEYKQQLIALQAQIDGAVEKTDRVAEAEFKGEYSKVQIQLAGSEEREALLKKRIDDLTMRASMAGVVTTFQLKQLLAGRQVQRGELLVELANDKKEWQLELDIEERRMGHVLTALNQSKAKTLPVEFVLATVAEETYQGQLDHIAARTETSEELGTVVPATVQLTSEEISQRRIGAEVSAKINCGKKSLGYVLFGDVIEFCQRYFW